MLIEQQPQQLQGVVRSAQKTNKGPIDKLYKQKNDQKVTTVSKIISSFRQVAQVTLEALKTVLTWTTIATMILLKSSLKEPFLVAITTLVETYGIFWLGIIATGLAVGASVYIVASGKKEGGLFGGISSAIEFIKHPTASVPSFRWFHYPLLVLFATMMVYGSIIEETPSWVKQATIYLSYVTHGVVFVVQVSISRVLFVGLLKYSPTKGLMLSCAFVALLTYSPIPEYIQKNFPNLLNGFVAQLTILIGLNYRTLSGQTSFPSLW